MLKLPYLGSSSTFYSVSPGIVLKSPTQVWEESTHFEQLSKGIANSFFVEKQILERLGDHPRIVRGKKAGFLLAEANRGSLQAYIDEQKSAIDEYLRRKWCWQSAEAIEYLHSKGVIHSDLRPENFLVHETGGCLDLWLCDFGGSTCDELGLDGQHLPDDPFFDPILGFVSVPATDIFSLGSIFYTIITGNWPYRTEAPKPGEDLFEYQSRVNELFAKGIFPETANILGGTVIMGCWTRKYAKVEEVLRALKEEMPLESYTTA